MKVIINADEFGVSRSINEAVSDSILNGVLSSSTLVAGGDEFEHAVCLAQRHFPKKVGLHLYFTDFKGCSNGLYSGTYERKTLPGVFTFLRNYFIGKITDQELEKEIEAQIVKAKSALGHLTHIDGHNNLHVLPRVRRILIHLMKKHEIDKVRLPQESLLEIDYKQPLQFIIKIAIYFFASQSKKYFKKNGIRFPEKFYGIAHEGKINEVRLSKILRKCTEKKYSEIMVHPAHIKNDNDAESLNKIFGNSSPIVNSLMSGYRWDDEYHALISRKIEDLTESLGIEIVGFEDLR